MVQYEFWKWPKPDDVANVKNTIFSQAQLLVREFFWNAAVKFFVKNDQSMDALQAVKAFSYLTLEKVRKKMLTVEF